MGRLAQQRGVAELTLPASVQTFNLPAGYYVVAYLTDDDPEQSEASKLTIAWANTYKSDIEVIASYLGGTARFAGIKTTKDLPYPIEGKWVCLATSTTVEDPITVYENCNRQSTAQAIALDELSSQKADIANESAQESGKLANAAAGAAADALTKYIPGWVPWVAGGAVAVGMVWGLARLFRG